MREKNCLVEAAYLLTPGIAQEAFEERLSLGLFPAFEEAKPGKGPKGQTFATPELPGLDGEALKGFASRFEAWKGKLSGSDRSGAWKQSVDAAYLSKSTLMFENTERLREAYGLLGARGLPQTGAPVWRETYTYDARGNRLEKRNVLGAIAYKYDEENRLESAGARTYGYDANGSLVTETLSGLSVSYRYDAERRLVASSATDPLVLGEDRGASSTTAVSYAYDALGRRNSRTGSGTTGKAATTTAERTLYDGLSFDALALYVDRDGRAAGRFGCPELAVEYLRANGVLVSARAFLETKDGEWRSAPGRGADRYYLTDTLGSVRTSLDGRGHVEEVFRYDAFGSMYEGSTDPVSRFAYTGKSLDIATGRYDYGFRDYDPMTGRFQTVDPIRDGENWYGYVGGDPVNGVDIYGLAGWSFPDNRAEDTDYHRAVLKKKYHLVQSRITGGKDKDGNPTFPRVEDFAVACQYFSAVNAFIDSGYTPRSDINDLADYVERERKKEGMTMETLLKDVFVLSKVERIEFAGGKTYDQVKALADGKPAILVYNQSDFWGNGSSVPHAISFADGLMFEPYIGRSGIDWANVKSQSPDASQAVFTDSIRGYYFNVEK